MIGDGKTSELKAAVKNADKAVTIDPTPMAEYQRRHQAHEQMVRQFERWERLGGYSRLVAFLIIAAVSYAIFRTERWLASELLLAVAAFVAAIAWHRHIVCKLERNRRATGYYARGIARLDDNWSGVGPTGQGYSNPEHPYAQDLDLFGPGSLYQLLCTARTRLGQDCLATWLLQPAGTAAVRLRQSAVEELRTKLDLREELGVLETSSESGIGSPSLLAWIGQPPLLTGLVRPLLAIVLAAASVAALVGWLFRGVGLGWFCLIAVVQGLFLLGMRRTTKQLTRDLDSVLDELNLLSQVLRIIEAERFAAEPSDSRLRAISARLHAGGRPASARIAQLARLVGYWETIRRNQFVAPLAFVLMLAVHLAYAIERWRKNRSAEAADWLAAVAEFESLSCLAGYAYEHPPQPFPEIVETGPVVDAVGLGHPLIPAARRVTNDLCLGAAPGTVPIPVSAKMGPSPLERAPQLLLLSGSNMSGKSTLLRTVGINVVLALAGAPVCAARLRVSPLAVATAMRTADSLQKGVSGFYAEIRRLRAIADLAAGPLPVLFLLDEILHGTNSHDRRIGAEAVIEGLLPHHAIGLITTHDLALAEITERLGARAANVHFEDELIDGQIRFDYRLRPGVVPKGNGLVLMRLLGFDV